jgi:site-specific recombinase XerD
MAHLSRWLADRGLGPDNLTVARVEEFICDRRVTSWNHRRLTVLGMAPLLEFLRGLEVVPRERPPVAGGPLERLLEEFADHLVVERGLAASTVRNYRSVASRFLAGRCSEGGRGVLDGVSAGEISAFVLAEAARCSSAALNNVTTGLRALLRFAYVQGYLSTLLVGAVPTAPGWRDSGLSRAVPPDQVARLLASCDRRTSAGRRDFAVLTVLVRLGLRAGEVAALTVDDVDWRTGEIVVTGKGSRRERLPLPVDVGQAIADYCRRGRRRGGYRSLFLAVQAPYVGLSNGGISEVVARACMRAGLARMGAHRLRHSAATGMRAAGAPLFEIGQALRHRHVASTALYAKDDTEALLAVARPWPGGAA